MTQDLNYKVIGKKIMRQDLTIEGKKLYFLEKIADNIADNIEAQTRVSEISINKLVEELKKINKHLACIDQEITNIASK